MMSKQYNIHEEVEEQVHHILDNVKGMHPVEVAYLLHDNYHRAQYYKSIYKYLSDQFMNLLDGKEIDREDVMGQLQVNEYYLCNATREEKMVASEIDKIVKQQPPDTFYNLDEYKKNIVDWKWMMPILNRNYKPGTRMPTDTDISIEINGHHLDGEVKKKGIILRPESGQARKMESWLRKMGGWGTIWIQNGYTYDTICRIEIWRLAADGNISRYIYDPCDGPGAERLFNWWMDIAEGPKNV